MIGGPACFFSIAFQFGVQERCVYISGTAFSLFLFSLPFCENKKSHCTLDVYVDVVVKGMSSNMHALFRTGYSDETLIQNENNVMHSCLLFSETFSTNDNGIIMQVHPFKYQYTYF